MVMGEMSKLKDKLKHLSSESVKMINKAANHLNTSKNGSDEMVVNSGGVRTVRRRRVDDSVELSVSRDDDDDVDFDDANNSQDLVDDKRHHNHRNHQQSHSHHHKTNTASNQNSML